MYTENPIHHEPPIINAIPLALDPPAWLTIRRLNLIG